MNNSKWEQVELKGDIKDCYRSDFGAVTYREDIYIYGGESKFNPQNRKRETHSDIRKLSIEQDQFGNAVKMEC